MNIVATVKHLYPSATEADFHVVDFGEGPTIVKWNEEKLGVEPLVSDLQAAEPAALAAIAWKQQQAQAQTELAKSDTVILRCNENSVAIPADWVAYRKALRAMISAQTGDVAQSPLPTRPNYPAGT